MRRMMWIHNKMLLSLLAAVVSLATSAQTVGELFVSMPDSIIPYLNSGDRSGLVVGYEAGNADGAVKVNALGDTTRIESLSQNFMQLRCNGARQMQVALLAGRTAADTVVCVVNSYYAPSAESTVSLYNIRWERYNSMAMPKVTIAELVHRPDSIGDDEYGALLDMIDPQLVKYTLEPGGVLAVSLSLPLVPCDKEKQLSSMIVQRKLKWNGISFN